MSGFPVYGCQNNDLYVNIRTFGGVGDNSTINTTAFQNAIAALAAAGGGVLYIPTGIYLVNMYGINGGTLGVALLFQSMNNVTILGDGVGASVIKLMNHATGFRQPGGDVLVDVNTVTNFSCRDLTLDGNGDNQTGEFIGLDLYAVTGAYINNVESKNFRSTGSEVACFMLSNSSDIIFDACKATTTNTFPSGSGFSSGSCTSVKYINCKAYNFTWCGFAGNGDVQTIHVGGIAQSNTQAGFNAEGLIGTMYDSCLAGGSGFGNGDGFRVNLTSKRTTLSNCISTFNTTGLNSEGTSLDTVVSGGVYEYNTYIGVRLDDLTSSHNTFISHETNIYNNGTAALFLNTGLGAVGSGNDNLVAPAVPGSGVALTNGNPYPFPVNIYILGGALTNVVFAGVSIGAAARFTLPVGSDLTISYGAAPTWVWKRS